MEQTECSKKLAYNLQTPRIIEKKAYNCFHNFYFILQNCPHFYLTVSNHPYTISDSFSSQFSVLDIHNQLCSARLLKECVLYIRVMAKEPPPQPPLKYSSPYLNGLLLHYFLFSFKWIFMFHFSIDTFDNLQFHCLLLPFLLTFLPSYVDCCQMLSGNQSRLCLNSCSFFCSIHILLLLSIINPWNFTSSMTSFLLW
jgi:hypothetical protein